MEEVIYNHTHFANAKECIFNDTVNYIKNFSLLYKKRTLVDEITLREKIRCYLYFCEILGEKKVICSDFFQNGKFQKGYNHWARQVIDEEIEKYYTTKEAI